MSSIAELSLIKEPEYQKVELFLLDKAGDWPVAALGLMPGWVKPEHSECCQLIPFGSKNEHVLIVFLHGKPLENCRKAGAEAAGFFKKQKATGCKIWSNAGNTDIVLAFAEGLLLGSYRFEKYKSQKTKGLKKVELWHPFLEKKQVKDLNILCGAVATTRSLVNEPASFLTAKKLSEAFEKEGKESGFEVEVLGKNKIQTLKMGGLLGVNQGSDLPPTFNILEYKPSHARNKKPIVLVGKGVVYDTGGHSLKTSSGMEYMKCDMAGAATVLGVFKAVAEMELPVYLIGLVPATDNRISAAALSPGDIITISDGSTVEVLNTDAEGRLILADALAFAKKYEPELVMDFATLTGAAARAIGKEGFVFMGNASEQIKGDLRKAGEEVYERGVEFPLWDEYSDYLKSEVADMKNIGGAEAGAITAGKFLQHFTDYPWLHFDIAGTSFFEGGAVGYIPKGGTGIGVRLITAFLKSRLA
jgi:leucyl aminopeptidase